MSPIFLDRRHLDKHQPEAAQREAAEMDDVKRTAGIAGVAAVVNHRWHDEAIFQREAPYRPRLEQHRPCRFAVVDRSVKHSCISDGAFKVGRSL
jgi:hypothetical protein